MSGTSYGACLLHMAPESYNEGCDLDFLRTEFGAPVSEPVIY